ncbi:MAG TPA: hypothetical protein VFE71_11435 [Bacteroidales bacterium]|jgi:hypothetical protein|nr:hypothetical protein [Bacteroidales bacterium]
MKKLFFATFVIAAIMFLGIGTKSSARIHGLTNNTVAFISYEVNINPDHNLITNSCASIVEITNDAGMVIGQPQMYQLGMNTYHFYEMGPVNGTRKAIITNEAGDHNSIPCYLISWGQTKTGIFRNGENYIFVLSTTGVIRQYNNTTVN